MSDENSCQVGERKNGKEFPILLNILNGEISSVPNSVAVDGIFGKSEKLKLKRSMSEVNNESQVSESSSLQWTDQKNQFQEHISKLHEENYMVDVTLSVSGERIQAHRLVLCAYSPLFEELLSQVTEEHPTIILSGISPESIRMIVEFMYTGEVNLNPDNVKGTLEAAHFLRIAYMKEFKLCESVSKVEDQEDETADQLSELNEMEEDNLDIFEHVYEDANMESEQSATEGSSENKKKRRRFSMKREYSEDMLANAIKNLRAGQTLIEASTKNNIPRSTLYMRAKALGIQLNACRNEYPAECMTGAINAVIGGSSLQQASEVFGIPKTVLWRRMQKEGYRILRPEMKRSYGSDKREAAVRALERGENLTKVAQEYQIPKTTLFRDKARLVDEGRLPTSFWRKRKTENDDLKRSRLEEAVAACRSGRMSQAAASVFYHIPKTTIWRRLQQDSAKTKKKLKLSSVKEVEDRMEEDANEITFCEVTSGIPITYIDENNIREDSLIILTTGVVDDLNLEGRAQIITSSDPNQEYITASTNIEDDSNYSSPES